VLHRPDFFFRQAKQYPVIFRKSNLLGEKTKSIFEKREQDFLKKEAFPAGPAGSRWFVVS
jgi:hypothetical protein